MKREGSDRGLAISFIKPLRLFATMFLSLCLPTVYLTKLQSFHLLLHSLNACNSGARARARSQDPNPGPPCGWEEAKHLSHCPHDGVF